MKQQIGEILTLTELAAYLRISKSTVYKLVREGQVPCQKVGRHWRFRKASIDSWLDNTNGSLRRASKAG